MSKRSRALGLLTALIAVAAGLVLPTTTAAALPAWPNLVKGQYSPIVTTAQYLLRHHGHDISADADFGGGTEAAAKAFQSANGLGSDGQIGPNTWSKLIVTVQRGSNSEAVKALQVELNRYGHGLTVDGDFGGNTDAAVRSFQSSHSLDANGQVGPLTWQTLIGDFPGYPAGYSLPLPRGALARTEYDDVDHTYPAIDLPVNQVAAYAIVSGTASRISESKCGLGVNIDVGNVRYTYCHFESIAISNGPVSAGQRIGTTGASGNAQGPHLHFHIKVNGGYRCPQKYLISLYDGGVPPAPANLPTTGCFD
ncbi:peptidoglycan-binding protein [Kribbella sp. NPDC056951]|uniref:peptidoglycan-binding protein n=1 Tax=Kribbella sp. NPDC056951 TaxID=3345978 RepID=UPI003638E0AF